MATDPPHDPVAGNHWLLLAAPQATAELRNDHFNAMLCPQGLEVPPVELVRGWLAAADMWGRTVGTSVGAEPDDGAGGGAGMLEEWKQAGQSIRRLLERYREMSEMAEALGEPRCRLNFATLDRMMVAAMEWQDLESGLGASSASSSSG